MIAVRLALMVMVATVRYPVPGGQSQLASLNFTMTKYSANVWMAPKAVVPHSSTARRSKRRPPRSGCNAGIASKATRAANSMLNDSIIRKRVVWISCSFRDRQGSGESKRGQTGKCRCYCRLGPRLPPQPEDER